MPKDTTTGDLDAHMPIALDRGAGECGPHFSAFSAFFSLFPGRSLSVMFKKKTF